MSDATRPPVESIENLITEFKLAQDEAVVRCDSLIAAAGQMQSQASLFEKIIENCSDGIFIVDADSGLVTQVNQAAGNLLHCEPSEIEGREQLSFLPQELHQEFKVAFRKVKKEGGFSSMRTRLLRPDGSEVQVDLSSNALPGQDQNLVVGFARDITAQLTAEYDLMALNESLEKRLEERTEEILRTTLKLEKAIADANCHAATAEEANQARSQFLANMTHEIRTPLNAVVGLLDLLMDMELGDKEKETAQVISRSASTLGTIINDILDFSKIEAGKLELEKVVFGLPNLVQKVHKTFSFQAGEKKLDLVLDMPDDLPQYVIGDPGRLRQVLVNLMGNALRFTDKGAVTLTVRKAPCKGRQVSVRFAVRDTGVGIAKQHQKDMFEAFTQADSTISRKFGGTGLGLNIANKLVQKMGGGLEVKSQDGEGSTFFFTANFGKAGHQQIKDQEKDQSKNKPGNQPESQSKESDETKSDFSTQHIGDTTNGNEGIVAEVTDEFMLNGRRRINLIIGALQNYDFGFAITEARDLEGDAQKVHSLAIVELLGELIQAADQVQQEIALNLAEDIKAELEEMKSVI